MRKNTSAYYPTAIVSNNMLTNYIRLFWFRLVWMFHGETEEVKNPQTENGCIKVQ